MAPMVGSEEDKSVNELHDEDGEAAMSYLPTGALSDNEIAAAAAAAANRPLDPMGDSERALEETQKTLLGVKAALDSSRRLSRQASKDRRRPPPTSSDDAGDDIQDGRVKDQNTPSSLPQSAAVVVDDDCAIVSQSDAEDDIEENGMDHDNESDNNNAILENPAATSNDEDVESVETNLFTGLTVIESDTPSNTNDNNQFKEESATDLVETPDSKAIATEESSAADDLPELTTMSADLEVAPEPAGATVTEIEAAEDQSQADDEAIGSKLVEDAPQQIDNQGGGQTNTAAQVTAAIEDTSMHFSEVKVGSPTAAKAATDADGSEGFNMNSSFRSDQLDESFIAPLRVSLKAETQAGIGSKALEMVVDEDGGSDGDVSVGLSISSAPATEQVKMKSSRKVMNQKIVRSPSSQSVVSVPVTRSAPPQSLPRGNSFKGLWRGLKRRITVATAFNSSPSKSKSPLRKVVSSSVSGPAPLAHAPIRRARTNPVGKSPHLLSASSHDDRGKKGRRPVARTRSRSEEPNRRRSRNVSTLTSDDLLAMEKIAKALKDNLHTTHYIDKRKQKEYKTCFYGSAAVDFLCQCTRTTRRDATKIGRELVEHFGLFLPITEKMHSISGDISAQHASMLLQDSSTVLYRFAAFLPSEVSRMNAEAKAKCFEEGVSVRDRRLGLRKFKKCFIGAEAVTYLVKSRISNSREEALTLAKKFIVEFNLFDSVNRDSDFLDSRSKLYRFVEKKNRYFSINNMFSTRLIQMGQNSDLSDDHEDFDYDDGKSDRSSAVGSVCGEGEDNDNDDIMQGNELIIAEDYQRLVEVAVILERGVKLSDNSKKAHSKKVSYVNTFVGARAVTFMVTSGLAVNRVEAQKLGRRLELEFKLFTEVTGKHDFGDSNHYYRFTEKKDRITQPMRVERPLEEIASLFEQGVKVKDYHHRLQLFKTCFTGSNAVDFLVNSRLAQSRDHAVRIGCQLVYNFNLFEKVTGNREFCDDTQFFRFTSKRARRSPEQADLKVRRKSGGMTLLMDRSSKSRAQLVPRHVSEEMVKLADSVMEGVKVKENKFRAKSYRQTFVGSDAVSFMVNSSLAMSRKEAVDLGRSLSKDVGLFIGIDGSKDFKDDYLLYRFSERFEDESDDENNSPQGISAKALPLEKIAEAFQKGVKVSDHKKRSKTYKGCFVGSEAVDFLVGAGFAESRVDAVELGRCLKQEFNLIEHHALKEREFEDEDILYKFSYEGEIRPLEVIEIEISRLMNIAKDFELCVAVNENKFRLRKYKSTFLGKDAVDYLMNSCVATSRKEAVQIGRALNKEFNLFEHVTIDRKFEDANIPYFFAKNDERYKGLNLEKKRAKRNIFAQSDGDETSSEEETDNMVGSMKSLTPDDGAVTFRIDSEDTEWANKMANFERRMNSTLKSMPSSRGFMQSALADDESVDSSVAREHEMKDRFFKWSSKFRKLDPRYQIEYFFDFVAQDGAEDVEAAVMEVDNLRPLFNFLPSRANVFTVWRPTSLDAIRKMMLGEAVGKGLDIKGKSAKRGKLSGFVPFLQIGENKHKSKIRPPSKEGVVRVFYPGNARRSRDIAAEKLERVGLEMIETVKDAKVALEDNSTTKCKRKDALAAMLLDMGPDPSITYIDECAPSRYGLEIPERLFWEAYFAKQDCTRKPGSEYDTGRPSQPAFQDMNFAAIRAEPKEDAPRAVIYQNADPDSPMNPFELLVAYEENNRVMPVVSDFDCFLVGTKRVKFTSPMADEQMDVLKWYVNEMETVMKTSKVGDSWTVNWLEVLKKAAREGFYPEMPRFGFGDPKSYSIMKNAVTRLSHSGAVRHGAECFNYYFPQDLDDEFLVIANDLPDNQPWAYVDVEGLQDILERKIDQGYTFPLNPKWVLCDSFRWKQLYDKLLLSDKIETQQSMNIWYPPESGLREQIERIHARRPNGFYVEGPGAETESDDSSSDSSGDGAKDNNMMSTVVALRLLEKFQARTKKFQAGKDDKDDS